MTQKLFAAHCNDAREIKHTSKCCCCSQLTNRIIFLQATIAVTERLTEEDVMMGDTTDLLPSGCPGLQSSLTASCWLLLRRNQTSLASLSLRGGMTGG